MASTSAWATSRSRCRAGSKRSQAVGVVLERVGHVRRFEAGNGRLDLGRAGDPDQPRARAQAARAAERGGAGHPAPPATTSTVPNLPLWLSAGRFGSRECRSVQASWLILVVGGRWSSSVS